MIMTHTGVRVMTETTLLGVIRPSDIVNIPATLVIHLAFFRTVWSVSWSCGVQEIIKQQGAVPENTTTAYQSTIFDAPDLKISYWAVFMLSQMLKVRWGYDTKTGEDLVFLPVLYSCQSWEASGTIFNPLWDSSLSPEKQTHWSNFFCCHPFFEVGRTSGK